MVKHEPELHIGDLETSWTEMLLYLPPEHFDPESQCVSDQAFHWSG